jgi:hypothetical protein
MQGAGHCDFRYTYEPDAGLPPVGDGVRTEAPATGTGG